MVTLMNERSKLPPGEWAPLGTPVKGEDIVECDDEALLLLLDTWDDIGKLNIA